MSGLNKGRRGQNKGHQGAPGWQRVNMSALPGKTPPTGPQRLPEGLPSPYPAPYSVTVEDAAVIQTEQWRLIEAARTADEERTEEERLDYLEWIEEEEEREWEEESARQEGNREYRESHPVPDILQGWQWVQDDAGVERLQVIYGEDSLPLDLDEREVWLDTVEVFVPSLTRRNHDTPRRGRIISFGGNPRVPGYLGLWYAARKWDIVRLTGEEGSYTTRMGGGDTPRFSSLREAIRHDIAIWNSPEHEKNFWDSFCPLKEDVR